MKKGFTLAEVLVTLGIIGVVAALAMPALNSAVQKTKVGPSLSKFMTMMANASAMIKQEEDADNISNIFTSNNANKRTNEFIDKIKKHVNLTEGASYDIFTYDGKEKHSIATASATGITAFIPVIIGKAPYSTPDDMTCWFYMDQDVDADDVQKFVNGNPPIGSAIVDINGEQKPNKMGRDVFAFFIFNDGSLLPYGSSKNFCLEDNDSIYCNSYKNKWKDGESGKCNETEVTGNANAMGLNCTASVIENKFKVIYKY